MLNKKNSNEDSVLDLGLPWLGMVKTRVIPARRYPPDEPDRHTFWRENQWLDCVHEACNIREVFCLSYRGGYVNEKPSFYCGKGGDT